MTKSIIVTIVAVGAIAIVTITAARHQKKAASAPDLDQQVNEVTRNLHPTKLNP